MSSLQRGCSVLHLRKSRLTEQNRFSRNELGQGAGGCFGVSVLSLGAKKEKQDNVSVP